MGEDLLEDPPQVRPDVRGMSYKTWPPYLVPGEAKGLIDLALELDNDSSRLFLPGPGVWFREGYAYIYNF
jgi:hypothetical protein